MLRRKKNLKTAATCIKKRDTVIDNDTKKNRHWNMLAFTEIPLRNKYKIDVFLLKKKKRKKIKKRIVMRLICN